MLRRSVTISLFSFCLGLFFSASPINAQSSQRVKVSQEQESQMFGRTLAALQDLHGGYPKEALSRYEKIVRDVEKYDYSQKLRWQAYDGYGLALFATGEKDKAFITLKRALEEANQLTSKEVAKSTGNLAWAYAEIGNFSEAIKQFKAAVTMEQDNEEVLISLGSVYRRAKMFDEARAVYEKMLALNPRNARAYQNLGNVYLDQGELEKALAIFERHALYSTDKETTARNIILVGFQYHERKEYEHALTLYNRALKITPDNSIAYADIGWSMLALGKTREAVQAFEKALTLNPPKDIKEYARLGLKQARAKS